MVRCPQLSRTGSCTVDSFSPDAECVGSARLRLCIDLSIEKTNKYASRESGDTAELVERPAGGLSVVVVDGQGSGQAAKTLSLLISSKAVALLKEGVRDGAVARAAHDFLFAYRHGKVSATLDILSVDLVSRSVVVTRNADAPLVIVRAGDTSIVEPTAGPIGRYHRTKPTITELPMTADLRVLLCTDGIPAAGVRDGKGRFDVAEFVRESGLSDKQASELASCVLEEAIRRDNGRPGDDMAVVALRLTDHEEERLIRRMTATVPLP